MYGQHCIKTWSSTQAIIATSSGEAEYYGIVKASSVGMGLRSLLADMGVMGTQLEVLTDATAAKQMASRTGLGTVRHIDTHYLWVQEKIKNKLDELERLTFLKKSNNCMKKNNDTPNDIESICDFKI